ncbi:MAG: type II toxin-antitoxin system RelE/ParE family toxin [Methylovirgula sp.]|jgi:plasmid stabilization system protein ParE
MRLRFTLEALGQIDAIRLYIEARSPQAASHIVERIFAEADRLGEFPQLGRVGFVPGTYEWTVPRLPYIIVHEFNEDIDEVVVLGVFHGAQAR